MLPSSAAIKQDWVKEQVNPAPRLSLLLSLSLPCSHSHFLSLAFTTDWDKVRVPVQRIFQRERGKPSKLFLDSINNPRVAFKQWVATPRLTESPAHRTTATLLCELPALALFPIPENWRDPLPNPQCLLFSVLYLNYGAIASHVTEDLWIFLIQLWSRQHLVSVFLLYSDYSNNICLLYKF